MIRKFTIVLEVEDQFVDTEIFIEAIMAALDSGAIQGAIEDADGEAFLPGAFVSAVLASVE
jgi:hypothetical protein